MKVRSAVFGATTLVILLTAGAAQSLSGSNTVYTDDIVDHNITAADLGTNSVTRPALGDNAVSSAEVADDSLTGADVKEATLEQSCGLYPKYGDVCGGGHSGSTTWADALGYCTAAGERLPTVAEALLLKQGYTGSDFVATSEVWTDDRFADGTSNYAYTVDATSPYVHAHLVSENHAYHCVQTPH